MRMFPLYMQLTTQIVALALAATDPVTMLGGPIPATEKALAQASLSIEDIGLYV